MDRDPGLIPIKRAVSVKGQMAKLPGRLRYSRGRAADKNGGRVKSKPLFMIWVGAEEPGIITAGKRYRILSKRREDPIYPGAGYWYSYEIKHDDGQLGFAASHLFMPVKKTRMGVTHP